MLVAAGERDGALAAYRRSLAIRETLAAADPGNTSGSATCRLSTTGSATCWWRGRRAEALAAYRGASRFARRSPPPIPATPSGSATCRQPHQDRRRAGDGGRARRGAGGLPRRPRDRARSSRPPIPAIRVAARPVRQSTTRSATCWWRQGGARMRWRPSAGASRFARDSPPPIPATPSGSATWSISHNRIGDVLRAAGRREEALVAYRRSFGNRRDTRRRRSRQHAVATRPVA